jgi:type III pantothenate kinase
MKAQVNILAIDAGNSRIKWGVANDDGWLRRDVLDTADAAQLGEALKTLPAPQRIVVSNVAGAQVRDAITQALAGYASAPLAATSAATLGVPLWTPLWIKAQAQQCGVRSGYADPAQLGADRWAGLIAAWKCRARAGRACVVVNAGTTMTVDALSSEGVFLGGVIVPGLDLMRAALDRGTAQLKLQPGNFCYFPDNTADAIMSGAINALAGTIERMRGFLAQTAQRTPLVVLSGGAATIIQPQLTTDDGPLADVERVETLVLDGLLEIARDAG